MKVVALLLSLAISSCFADIIHYYDNLLFSGDTGVKNEKLVVFESQSFHDESPRLIFVQYKPIYVGTYRFPRNEKPRDAQDQEWKISHMEIIGQDRFPAIQDHFVDWLPWENVGFGLGASGIIHNFNMRALNDGPVYSSLTSIANADCQARTLNMYLYNRRSFFIVTCTKLVVIIDTGDINRNIIAIKSEQESFISGATIIRDDYWMWFEDGTFCDYKITQWRYGLQLKKNSCSSIQGIFKGQIKELKPFRSGLWSGILVSTDKGGVLFWHPSRQTSSVLFKEDGVDIVKVDIGNILYVHTDKTELVAEIEDGLIMLKKNGDIRYNAVMLNFAASLGLIGGRLPVGEYATAILPTNVNITSHKRVPALIIGGSKGTIQIFLWNTIPFVLSEPQGWNPSNYAITELKLVNNVYNQPNSLYSLIATNSYGQIRIFNANLEFPEIAGILTKSEREGVRAREKIPLGGLSKTESFNYSLSAPIRYGEGYSTWQGMLDFKGVHVHDKPCDRVDEYNHLQTCCRRITEKCNHPLNSSELAENLEKTPGIKVKRVQEKPSISQIKNNLLLEKPILLVFGKRIGEFVFYTYKVLSGFKESINERLDFLVWKSQSYLSPQEKAFWDEFSYLSKKPRAPPTTYQNYDDLFKRSSDGDEKFIEVIYLQ